jgi:hypothetical protein
MANELLSMLEQCVTVYSVTHFVFQHGPPQATRQEQGRSSAPRNALRCGEARGAHGGARQASTNPLARLGHVTFWRECEAVQPPASVRVSPTRVTLAVGGFDFQPSQPVGSARESRSPNEPEETSPKTPGAAERSAARGGPLSTPTPVHAPHVDLRPGVRDGRGRRRSHPIITIAADDPPQLSFVNMVEAHVLSAIRYQHGVALPAVRRAVKYALRDALDGSVLEQPAQVAERKSQGLQTLKVLSGWLLMVRIERSRGVIKVRPRLKGDACRDLGESGEHVGGQRGLHEMPSARDYSSTGIVSALGRRDGGRPQEGVPPEVLPLPGRAGDSTCRSRTDHGHCQKP